jgi:hypothetical protein
MTSVPVQVTESPGRSVSLSGPVVPSVLQLLDTPADQEKSSQNF